MERPVTSRSPNIWYDFFNKPHKFNDTVKTINESSLLITNRSDHRGHKIMPYTKQKVSPPDELLDLLEDIYSEEQHQVDTLSEAQYLAITPELKKVFSEKLESTKGCMAKLKNVIELIDRMPDK